MRTVRDQSTVCPRVGDLRSAPLQSYMDGRPLRSRTPQRHRASNPDARGDHWMDERPPESQQESSMIASRRAFLAGLGGAATVAIGPRAARSQSFVARQYHPQPVASHLHIYLTKLWDAVRQ